MTQYSLLTDPVFYGLVITSVAALAALLILAKPKKIYVGGQPASGVPQPYDLMPPVVAPYVDGSRNNHEAVKPRVQEADEYTATLRDAYKMAAALSSLHLPMCPSCHKNLRNPSTGRLDIVMRGTPQGRRIVVELVHKACGASIWQSSYIDTKIVATMAHEEATEQEAQAIQSLTPLRQLFRQPATTPKIQPEEQVEAETPRPIPMEPQPSLGLASIAAQEAIPRPQQEAGNGEEYTDAKNLMSLDENTLIGLFNRCGGCPHYNLAEKRCLKGMRSGKVFPSHRVCAWWATQQVLEWLRTGRPPVVYRGV